MTLLRSFYPAHCIYYYCVVYLGKLYETLSSSDSKADEAQEEDISIYQSLLDVEEDR
jgi:hypothetical protein